MIIIIIIINNTCGQADYHNMPYSEGHFDKVYAIEATCHAQSLFKIYSEVFRVLKPGGMFALYEWIMTDVYNPSDPYHKKLKADILVSRFVFPPHFHHVLDGVRILHGMWHFLGLRWQCVPL